MNAEKILNALSEIDESFVMETARLREKQKLKNRFAFSKISIAAALAITVVAAFVTLKAFAPHLLLPQENTSLEKDSFSPQETWDGSVSATEGNGSTDTDGSPVSPSIGEALPSLKAVINEYTNNGFLATVVSDSDTSFLKPGKKIEVICPEYITVITLQNGSKTVSKEKMSDYKFAKNAIVEIVFNSYETDGNKTSIGTDTIIISID